MKRKQAITLALCAVIVVLLAAVGFLFWKYQQAKGSSDQAKETSARIIGEVSNLYLVPKDEEPTVAQIQDKQKLGNQDFFKSSENGDYLLVYQKAKLAIVYREGVKKLVTVGPVNVGDEQADTQTAEQDQEQSQEGQTAGAQTEDQTPPQ